MMPKPAFLIFALLAFSATARADDSDAYFIKNVAPILEERCLVCHNDARKKGKLSLQNFDAALAGGKSEDAIVPGEPKESLLLEYISGKKPEMPKQDDPLSESQIKIMSDWIAAGAKWPKGLKLKIKYRWWSWKPLERPAVPKIPEKYRQRVRTPIDAFIISKLQAKGLSLSPEADRRTLIRRLYFDLVGLPPSPEEVEQFVKDPDSKAYEKLVERLLASPRYGERWARHWLDVVHYGDTMGYDKDKVRPNAWPYRDYVIRALNEDKPYGRFVKEQLAGDVLYSGTTDGIVALGFIVAGPFDWVGHIEVKNNTMEKKRIRNLDRDDMVASTMNTFTSLTVGCARCHDHKFDPVTQRDYYSLQAVFAAVDRANRPYALDPNVARRSNKLQREIDSLTKQQKLLETKVKKLAGAQLADVDRRLESLKRLVQPSKRPEYGYHSKIEAQQDKVKWVQVDLGKPTKIAEIIYVGCFDNFNNIGAGFGFPVRYKIELSDDPKFEKDIQRLVDHTQSDVTNPKLTPQTLRVDHKKGRYVRVTATKLAPRQNDFIFALAELRVLTSEGKNVALGAAVTALDSIEAPPRWRKKNLVDGFYGGADNSKTQAEIAEQTRRRDEIIQRVLKSVVQGTLKKDWNQTQEALAKAKRQRAQLPKSLKGKAKVYAATTHFKKQGSFVQTGGKPRPIYVLKRGDEKQPDLRLGQVQPASIAALENLRHHFDLPKDHKESDRRAALAAWIVDKQNPLSWRSIVNRVWHYHFGRGIVDTPNDFGWMGSRPTHPELLDWLAVEFRDSRQSLKDLHRLIVNSATYRQFSGHNEHHAKIDGGNRFLWRMNRRKLEAEAVRDAVLVAAGKLDRRMGGPGFRSFGFKDDHSPLYKYHEHDPDNPQSHRRSVYRFIVRSAPDPFMTSLDCADPSLSVAKRSETLTANQALALLNNKFMVRMSEHFASRVEKLGQDTPAKINAAFQLAMGRAATGAEQKVLRPVADQHGMSIVCRLIFNLNEFVFVD